MRESVAMVTWPFDEFIHFGIVVQKLVMASTLLASILKRRELLLQPLDSSVCSKRVNSIRGESMPASAGPYISHGVNNF